MKKKILIVILVILFIISFYLMFINKKEKTFYLEEKYYEKNTLDEIELEELNHLIENKENFGIFIYQPMCATSSNFESVLNDFQAEYQINFKKIAFSKVKDHLKFLKYYPSFIIYKNGEMVDFLEADKKEDVAPFTKKNEFANWLTKYVKLKNKIQNNSELEEEKESNDNNTSSIKLDHVIREDNKVNIYFFWGQGCPHCEEEHKYFKEIEETYGDKYNIYPFEVWYNEENQKILEVFAENMGETVTGVPYTIIGEKSFSGFSEKIKILMEEEIKKNHHDDIYFDKIEKNS